MCANSKKVTFLKFCSMVQKLFNVEIFLFLHCSYVEMASVVLFQHRITFEPLNQISKTKLFGISSHVFFNYLNVLRIFNHFYPL